MLEGKVHAAIRMLDDENSGGILNLTDQTLYDLKLKHPDSAPVNDSVLMKGETPFIDPVMFENIDETTISKAALRTKGAAGPSGVNADGWRRMLLSKNYGKTGIELRKSLAKFAKTLCLKELNHELDNSLEAYISCRLIPLDKKPGVRPIGIGEVIRRIIGKAIISVIKPDILNSAGSLQLCAGLPSGCEAAAHAMNDIFKEEDTDALLLVDASNAFNTLNRKVLLHNIKYLCPPMATYIRNCYGAPSRLFIIGGKEISSAEGTTQGDPFAMPAYAVGIVPLLPLLKSVDKEQQPNDIGVKHAAYADDLGGAGELQQLKCWWNRVIEYGPLLGYYPNASKSWLIVKEEKMGTATEIFADTKINITTTGRKYLGSFIGTDEGRKVYIKELVNCWMEQIGKLSKIAMSEPQAAYAAFISGFKHKLIYFMRTTPNMHEQLKPLDDLIDKSFIPAITEGHQCTMDERKLLSLPIKLGGLSIPIFTDICSYEFGNSRRATNELSDNIKQQQDNLKFDKNAHHKIATEIAKERQQFNKTSLDDLRQRMTPEQKRANDVATMKGASSWLSSMPLKAENFVLNKREFYDAIRLRYRLDLKYLPSLCACGKRFTVDHAMSCMKGGYIHQRHDEVRDIFGKLAEEISKDVEIEPHLIPLSGEHLERSANAADEARLDLSVRGFWQRGQKAFFDVRVFNPFAPTHRSQKLPNVFSAQEKEKKRAYGQRVIDIEHGSFTPLVFSPLGGCGREAERFLSVLAKRISDKRDIEQSVVTNWIRSVLSFALLRSAILCVRGSRNRKRKFDIDPGNIEICQNSNEIK